MCKNKKSLMNLKKKRLIIKSDYYFITFYSFVVRGLILYFRNSFINQ